MKKLILSLIAILSITHAQSFRFKRPVKDNIQTNGSYLYGEPRYGNTALAHLGIDIAARYDTVFAAAPGVITFVGYNPNDTVGGYEPGGGGNYITQRATWDGKNVYMLHMHLQKPLVTSGTTVVQGQPIAISGNTGNSTGAHLHFEIRMNTATYATPGSRRNAELWAGMTGMGAIYGRVPNAPNSTRVDISPDPKPRPPYTTYGYSLTYNFNDPYVGSDDIYNENYGIGDVKPGTYTITALGGTYTRIVTVGPGQVVSADPPTDIEEENLPSEFTLYQNYPNPFNPSTVISFNLVEQSVVNATVYDVMGREIVTLISSEIPAGKHSVTFDASNLPSGIYLLRLIAGKNQNIIKMTLNK
ncbi:MAG: peptidoglycan DD-metalloendopeptidase family protein [Ignavibacteriales bacterium]|jgi:murein DD-endopeptidase MepM/ murein hydrolase activator NlpD|nr:peptidoglycan DD-metalloendopeptidase family protein [Ignavibacteriales bacterium]